MTPSIGIGEELGSTHDKPTTASAQASPLRAEVPLWRTSPTFSRQRRKKRGPEGLEACDAAARGGSRECRAVVLIKSLLPNCFHLIKSLLSQLFSCNQIFRPQLFSSNQIFPPPQLDIRRDAEARPPCGSKAAYAAAPEGPPGDLLWRSGPGCPGPTTAVHQLNLYSSANCLPPPASIGGGLSN